MFNTDTNLQLKYPMFWKKSPTDKLKKKYEQLMKEAFDLSKTDRKKSDEKTAEANEVMQELEKLLNKGG